MPTRTPSKWAIPLGLAATATVFAVGVLWLRILRPAGLVAYDFYGQFYVFLLHALNSLRSGGGLWWNPYQDCGHPFFGNIVTGLLYPGNVLFVVLPREVGYLSMVVVHLTIAGIGTFLLCRELRLRPAASLCGALALQLGWTAVFLASWSPTHLAPFAWLPIALWRTERLVRAPEPRGALLLAAVLALQLLPGFPQTTFFTYQLIALRVAWAVLLRQSPYPRAMLAAVGAAMLLPVFLNAVQLLPALEVARESIRSSSLGATELGTRFSWTTLANSLAGHAAMHGNAPLLLLAALAIASACGLGRWSDVTFWGVVAAGYFVVSLGPGSLLFAVYEHLPLGMSFRGPGRLLWVTNMAVAVLTALGSEALLSAELRRTRFRSLALALLTAAAGAVLCVSSNLRTVDLLSLGAIALLAMFPPRLALGRIGAGLLVLLVLVDTMVVGTPPLFELQSGEVYATHEETLAAVRRRSTAQDRILIVGSSTDLGLMPKSATLYRIPNIHDYAPLESRRYVEFFTFMRTGRRLRNIEDWYWLFNKLLPATLQRTLFDLTAARYLIVDAQFDTTARAFHGGLRLLFERDGLRVYENDSALPRARWISHLVVLAEERVLPSLANGEVDGRSAAAVSEPPPSGFTGSPTDVPGTADIVTDEPERVVVRVRAPQAGFLFLADQYFPGWTATVNGEPSEILPANHAFRVVAVPGGESEVVFRYRPRSIRMGAILSLFTIAIVGLALYRQRTRSVRLHMQSPTN